MKCPVCNTELKMTDRQGVEIDYCPNCRGVWLDRGELDKIIERSATIQQQPVAAPPPPSSSPMSQPQYREERRGYDDDDRKYHEKKKRKGFLDELFDF